MEAINLNLIPNGTNPVVHCSQYDEGREFRFNLFDGASVFVLDGTESITCDIKKPDGNIVTAAVPNTEDDYIIVTTTLQMCACSGNSLGSINISKGGINLYTLNFVLYCERSPLENGIESESSIHNLNTMVDEMVAEDVAEQYDSANVIFDNAPTDNHGIGYTVTSEGIKTAIDNAFDYDNTASGSLVHITDGADNIPVKSLASEITAVQSGNGQPKSPDNPYTISGFNNGIITRCGKNLIPMTVASVKAINTLGMWSGNAYTFNNVVFTLQTDTDGNITGISTNGTASATSQFYIANNYTLQKGNYILNGCPSGGGTEIARLQVNTGALNIDTGSGANITLTEVYNSCVCFIRIGSGYNPNGMVFKPMVRVASDTDDTFAISNGNTYTFTFGQTVYGGYFDNKGNLVVTHNIVDLGSFTWVASSTSTSGKYRMKALVTGLKPASTAVAIPDLLCASYITVSGIDTYSLIKGITASHTESALFVYDNNYDTSESAIAFKTAMSGVMLVYELATPITLEITSQDIPTLLGENNIFSNCGDVEIEYYTSKSNDILDFIDSEIGKKNGTNIPIEENSQDSIKDYIDNVSLSGLPDTDISGESVGQVLTFDGDNWVNANQIVVKYEEKDIAFDSSGEGTLYYANGYILGLKDIPSDSLYIGYITYMAGTKTMVKGFNRSATSFDSTAIANTTRKIGIYYLDNIATQ